MSDSGWSAAGGTPCGGGLLVPSGVRGVGAARFGGWPLAADARAVAGRRCHQRAGRQHGEVRWSAVSGGRPCGGRPPMPSAVGAVPARRVVRWSAAGGGRRAVAGLWRQSGGGRGASAEGGAVVGRRRWTSLRWRVVGAIGGGWGAGAAGGFGGRPVVSVVGRCWWSCSGWPSVLSGVGGGRCGGWFGVGGGPRGWVPVRWLAGVRDGHH